ncbi:hypothetical protein L1987_67052 [Smallanthus sonchifolius]|uniref:Uncharacterized protein n=1 Tax=Smallanthus sonchifolius TaxID=185202 RepID=A0ACB9BZ37_9ASTR|nr:hypothetical protein L1987_67052 [Smallanthus sonchifolius]
MLQQFRIIRVEFWGWLGMRIRKGWVKLKTRGYHQWMKGVESKKLGMVSGFNKKGQRVEIGDGDPLPGFTFREVEMGVSFRFSSLNQKIVQDLRKGIKREAFEDLELQVTRRTEVVRWRRTVVSSIAST